MESPSGTRKRRPRPTNLGDAFVASAVARRSRDAVRVDGARRTYDELLQAGRRVAQGIADLVDPGGTVAIIAPNGVGYVEALLGTLFSGCAAMPVDPASRPDELRRLLSVGRPALALVDTACSEQTGDALASMATRSLTIDAARERDLELGHDPAVPSPVPAPRPVRPAMLFSTSGVSGPPKLIRHSHGMLLGQNDRLQRLHREFFGSNPIEGTRNVVRGLVRYRSRLLKGMGHQVWMTPISFFSIAGNSVLLASLLGGHTLVTEPAFNPRSTLRAVGEHRVNILALTPSMLRLLLRVPNLKSYDVSSLLMIGLGGASTPPELAKRARDTFGCGLAIGYGMTELGGSVTVTRIHDVDDVQINTVGKALPGVELRVVDEAGQPVADGAVGELVCRVDGMADGIVEGTGTGERSVDGWYHTGDLGTIDADGCVRIVGRRSELVIRGGKNISPEEVEQVLAAHTAVEACAVLGVPRARVGEELWAFVVPRDGHTLTTGDLIEHCRARLNPTKVPDHYRLVQSLPRTPDGKVRKYQLRQEALAEDRV